ncbi:MAG: glycosyltransferase family 2 protein [Candidatus Diapherotrites archaeon]|nr:glycosyltransferase family 2 protein [Candidatus Diapherotrites archaeon]
MGSVSVIVPAFNEEKRIGKVLERVFSVAKKNPDARFNVIVVDDGSSDRTFEAASKAGTIALRHPVNRGVGAATITGIEKAKSLGSGVFVTLDADEQHFPEELMRLAAPVLEGKADIAIGSRFLKKDFRMPVVKKLGNAGLNLLVLLLYGIRCSDTQSGYRAFNRRAIDSMKLTIDRYGLLAEVFGEIQRHKLRFVEVPVSSKYLDHGKGTGITDGIRIALDLVSKRIFG